MTHFATWIQNHRRKRALLATRQAMAEFGHDLSHLTDEEIEAAVACFSEALHAASLSCAEVAERLTAVSRAFAASQSP